MMLPSKLKNKILLHTSWGKKRYLNYLFKYDRDSYFNYSCMNADRGKMLATKMRIICHTIEKALSLPDCRPGFGKEKVITLINYLNEYEKIEMKPDSQVELLAKSTISSYCEFQKMNNIDVSFIPDHCAEISDSSIYAGVQTVISSEWKGNFEEIANHRHSIRYYSSVPVNLSDIEKAVSLAQTAPSACNRQSTQVFACTSPEKIQKILHMHGGMRGFGTPSVIFAITGDLSHYEGEYERNTVFVDGGIFCMNLLYSLDSYGIGCCPVIWGGDPTDDKKLKALLSIPDSNRIIILITGGYYPKPNYRVACSPKKYLNSILKIIS